MAPCSPVAAHNWGGGVVVVAVDDRNSRWRPSVSVLTHLLSVRFRPGASLINRPSTCLWTVQEEPWRPSTHLGTSEWQTVFFVSLGENWDLDEILEKTKTKTDANFIFSFFIFSRYYAVWFIFFIMGLATLLPWNFFMTATMVSFQMPQANWVWEYLQLKAANPWDKTSRRMGTEEPSWWRSSCWWVSWKVELHFKKTEIICVCPWRHLVSLRTTEPTPARWIFPVAKEPLLSQPHSFWALRG